MSQDPKISEIVTRNLFKVFVQIWNFSPLQSTPPVTGCSDLSAAPTAGNTAKNLQWKCCQGPLAILTEPQQNQRNAFLSNPASPVDTKQSHKERGWVSGWLVEGWWWWWWYRAIISFFSKNCWTLKVVWARALSWCKNQSPLCHFSGRFRCRL